MLPGGGFVVADQRRALLHFFNASGERFATAGGSGAGPGEFGFLYSVRLRHDTVVARDRRHMRENYYTVEGSYLGSQPLQSPLPTIGPFEDGSFVVGENVTRQARGNEPQLFQDSTEYRYVARTNRVISTLGRYPQPARFADMTEGFYIGLVPFGQDPTYLGINGRLLVAEAAQPELRIVRLDGSTERTIAVPDMSVEVDDSLIMMQQEMFARETSERTLLRLQRIFVYPNRTPPYGRVAMDQTGAIWVSSPPLPPENAFRFVVLTEEGSLIDDVQLRGDGRLWWLDGNETALLLREKDEHDVPSVVLHRRTCARN
jgi:hypothetical protein